MIRKETLIVVGLAAVAVAGAVEAASTAIWTLRSGLFATRPPLPVSQTLLRVAIVFTAGGLLLVRRDLIERITLIFAVIAAGSSALFGLGVRSPLVDALRLIFHFLAYSMAVVWSIRLLLTVGIRRSEEVRTP
jgi:hypothetical protein